MNTVAVIGATENPQRYAYTAQKLLLTKGYTVLPVTPKYQRVLGVRAYASVRDIEEPVDTVSIYVNPHTVRSIAGDIVALRPRRIIFNPGTEDEHTEKMARARHIHTVSACTIVLLKTDQF
jgi:hypothetical protein